MSAEKDPKAKHPSAQRYILTGILTIIPIWVTWLIVEFLLDLLSDIGDPVVEWISQVLQPHSPTLYNWLTHPLFQLFISVALVLLALYIVGLLATKVIGRKFIKWVDDLIDQIPLIKTIYGATKKFLSSIQQKPDGVQRVVLIDFPSPEMKTVGFVTQTFKDADTGRELAAVYVPTTPNPTSGYLEIVPLDKVTSTAWTVDEAMTFIVSGGAVAPKTMNYEGKK